MEHKGILTFLGMPFSYGFTYIGMAIMLLVNIISLPFLMLIELFNTDTP